MGDADPRLSRVLTAHAFVQAGLGIAHSLRTRGLRRTLLFIALGHAIPAVGEYAAVNVMALLRHRVEPRFAGVPAAVAVGWFNVGYGTFAVMESVLKRVGWEENRRRRALPPATALAAANLDLLLDPCGLDVGLWEWTQGGRYASDVRGSNGRRGIPLVNFAGWLVLMASVVWAYLRLEPPGVASRSRSETVGPDEAGRGAALLLLIYYLPAAVWAVRRRRWKYLVRSAPFLVMLATALGDRAPAP
jgi:uncharacterized membrane protein